MESHDDRGRRVVAAFEVTPGWLAVLFAIALLGEALLLMTVFDAGYAEGYAARSEAFASDREGSRE